MTFPIDHALDDGWTLCFKEYDRDDETWREAILALGNGVTVTRAASMDAEISKYHYPGTYRAGCYEDLVSKIDGEIDETESLPNLPNWLSFTFRAEGGPWFDLDDVKLESYRHGLNLRNGVAWRELVFTDAGGRRSRLRERRFVSMADPHVSALRVEITPENWSGGLEIKSAIDGDVVNVNVDRYHDYEPRHIQVIGCRRTGAREIALASRLRRRGTVVAQAVRTNVKHPGDAHYDTRRGESSIAELIRCDAEAGKTIAVDKIATLFTSDDDVPSSPAEAAQARLALCPSFDALENAHARAWGDIWRLLALDAEHENIALSLRFHAFHILQTVSPHSAPLDIGVPARGWHGEVYRGHIFWDELFVFPFLNFRFPDLARSLLMYRYRRLDQARENARDAGYRGAMYPWRSARGGREVTPRHQKNLLSGHWMRDPTRLQRHIGSAVAFNVWQYYLATGDTDFLADYGAEMMLEIARFWASIAQYNPRIGRFEIKGVIGPDEYHNSYPERGSPGTDSLDLNNPDQSNNNPDQTNNNPGLNNNVYTNIMAVWSLCRAREVLGLIAPERREKLLRRLSLNDVELERWDNISRKMRLVFHHDNIISQFEGFEKLRELDTGALYEKLPPSFADKRIDWALEAIGESADNFQVIKQADALTVFYLLPETDVAALFRRLGYPYSREMLRRTAEYYLERTTHRSSLSEVIYAGVLAEAEPENAWKLFQNGLMTDLKPLRGESTAEGIHLGAIGGTLDVLQRRYLGVIATARGLFVQPAVPKQLGRVRFRMVYHRQSLLLDATFEGVRIHSEPANARSLEIRHDNGKSLLRPGRQVFVRNRINTPQATRQPETAG